MKNMEVNSSYGFHNSRGEKDMKRISTFLIIFVSLLIFLSACNNNVGEELVKYNNEDMNPLSEKALELKEMEKHFYTIVQDPKKAHQYIKDEVIPFLNELNKNINSIQKNLKTDEVKDLNAIEIKQSNYTLHSFEKLAKVLVLQIPPVTDEEQKESEKLYQDVQKINEDIDKAKDKYNQNLSDLADKYDVSKELKLPFR